MILVVILRLRMKQHTKNILKTPPLTSTGAVYNITTDPTANIGNNTYYHTNNDATSNNNSDDNEDSIKELCNYHSIIDANNIHEDNGNISSDNTEGHYYLLV